MQEIEFVSFHRPALEDGEYELVAKQQVRIDGKFGWGSDAWTGAPSVRLNFSVAGPRFSIEPGLIQSQFPPPKSIGEYYNVLPHIILSRTTLPWERTIDHSPPSTSDRPTPWIALLLFDKRADGGAPSSKNVSLEELSRAYLSLYNPPGLPEFVKFLDRGAKNPEPRELRLEVSQHSGDRLTVIDVPKQLLWKILPSEEEIGWLSHVRMGQDSANPANRVGYPVVVCNRLPSPGAERDSPGTQSVVHLVSLEARKPLLDELKQQPKDDNLVRLISLASWSFSTLQRNKTFTGWLKEAWCPETRRKGSQSEAKPIHCLRMPDVGNQGANALLGQGYAPVKHQTRTGNHLVSWYRGPLIPGASPATDLSLPIRSSDRLVRYLSDVAMFDVGYAAAWELGRLLTLRSKKVSVSLFNWKRAAAQQAHQSKFAQVRVAFAPDHSVAPTFPAEVSEWFAELCRLEHVPFHYLVAREEMLPVNSLRFFRVDPNWVNCLLDGAFSVGRAGSADLERDRAARLAHLPEIKECSGFLLRSPVVTGWPHLEVEAYDQVLANDEQPKVPPVKCLRFDRLGEDVLLCLFEGEIRTVDVHERPEAIHFGVDTGDDPAKIGGYKKAFRDKHTGALNSNDKPADLPWKSIEKRTLSIEELAKKVQAADSAEFGVSMLEGVQSVRFVKG
jgi:hypothetical protein